MSDSSETQRMADVSEMRFALEATARGLRVSKPLTTCRYDFLVEHGTHCVRVQVKSTGKIYDHGMAKVCIRRTTSRRAADGQRKAAYTVNEADYVAALVVPANVWFIIPVSEIQDIGGNHLNLFPYGERSRSKYIQFRERWELLGAPASDKEKP